MEDTLLGCAAIVIGIFLLVAVFMGIASFKWNTDANGTHSGIVTAIEQSGVFFKNYHVYFKTNSTSSQEDNYCVPQDQNDLINQLRDAQEKQKTITLHYTGVTGFGWNLCSYDQITGISQ